MLVLTRKIDEQIKIGDDITITVIKLRNNQIRLGIDAPRDVRVLRAELEVKETIQASASEERLRSAKSEPVLKSESIGSTAPLSKSPQSRIRNEVIDGLVSADEMIAKALPDSDQRDNLLSGLTEDSSQNVPTKPSLQIFSGRVRAKRSDDAGAMRAPLSDYFSAT